MTLSKEILPSPSFSKEFQMKSVNISVFSSMLFLLCISCALAPPVFSGTGSNGRSGSVRGDILVAVKEGPSMREADPHVQQSGMSAATLYIPTQFRVSPQGGLTFSSTTTLSGFQMTGGKSSVIEGVKISVYSIEFTNVLPKWKGRRYSVSLPASRLLVSPTEALVFKALRDSGRSSGTFVLRSVSYSAFEKKGKAVVEVGP
jgi:hypothetical protein